MAIEGAHLRPREMLLVIAEVGVLPVCRLHFDHDRPGVRGNRTATDEQQQCRDAKQQNGKRGNRKLFYDNSRAKVDFNASPGVKLREVSAPVAGSSVR